jgi:hypothetical protein
MAATLADELERTACDCEAKAERFAAQADELHGLAGTLRQAQKAVKRSNELAPTKPATPKKGAAPSDADSASDPPSMSHAPDAG